MGRILSPLLLAVLFLHLPISQASADNREHRQVRASFSNYSPSPAPRAGRASSSANPKYWFSPTGTEEQPSFRATIKNWEIVVQSGQILAAQLNPTGTQLNLNKISLAIDEKASISGGKVLATAVGVMGISRQLKRNAKHKEVVVEDAFPGTGLELSIDGDEIEEIWTLKGKQARASFEQNLTGIDYFKLKSDGSLAIVTSDGEVNKSRPQCHAFNKALKRKIPCRILPTGIRSYSIVTPVELQEGEHFVIQSKVSFH